MPNENESSAAQPKPSPPREAEFPTTGRLLGLDYGSKRIGVAVSNDEQTIASPLELWARRTAVLDAARLRSLVQDYGIVGIVVGLPVHMSGAEGGKAREAKQFGRWAASASGQPVRFFDERFTTARAEEHLLSSGMTRRQRQARLDKLAAQIMLQAYLDAPHRGQAPADLRR
ncbi:MAG TPA: Holliday junction resolvase RuvX [Planctomycetaceae bacterium]|nr:Holliday junction resolvase RuvX [Planctomycetaceae bacterium]